MEEKIKILTHEERLELIMKPIVIQKVPSKYLGNSSGVISVKMPYKD